MITYAPLFPILEKVESSLGLPNGFIESLEKEDDWSFIVKSHALIETMLTQVLTSKTDPRLENVFAKMAFTRGQTSKIKAAEALNLITEAMKDVIYLYSEIRNKYVHSVKYVTTNLVGYFQNMDSNVLQKYSGSIFRLLLTNPDEDDIKGMKNELLKSPKDILAVAVFIILGSLLFELHPIEKELAEKDLLENGLLIAFVLLLGLIWEQREANSQKKK